MSKDTKENLKLIKFDFTKNFKMKKTALYNSHLELNAKLIDFAGFMMPVQYEGVNIEHKNGPLIAPSPNAN